MHALLALALALPAPQDPGPLLLREVHVVDVENGALLEDRDVLLRDGRIAGIGPTGGLEAAPDEPGTRIVDAGGGYLIPGLWDMHVHLRHEMAPNVAFPLFVAHGVTGVREMGSDGEVDGEPGLPEMQAWRAAIERGELVGPRLIALSSFPVSGDLGGAEGVREIVARAVRRGADLIKVKERISEEDFLLLAEEAQRAGIPFGGHVCLSLGTAIVSELGQASVEHARDLLFDGFPGAGDFRAAATTQRAPMEMRRRMVAEHDPELVREIADALAWHGTAYVPTHVTRRFDALAHDADFVGDPRTRWIMPQQLAGWMEDVRRTNELYATDEDHEVLMRFFELGLEDTRIAHEAGVRVLLGTDANDSFVFSGSSAHDELELLARAGLTPVEVLRAATWEPAEFLGERVDHGSVEVGKVADLVLLRGNPLEDVSNVRTIEAVVLGGRFHDRETLDGMIAGVERAVAAMGTGGDGR